MCLSRLLITYCHCSVSLSPNKHHPCNASSLPPDKLIAVQPLGVEADEVATVAGMSLICRDGCLEECEACGGRHDLMEAIKGTLIHLWRSLEVFRQQVGHYWQVKQKLGAGPHDSPWESGPPGPQSAATGRQMYFPELSQLAQGWKTAVDTTLFTRRFTLLEDIDVQARSQGADAAA